jgi:type IV secretory pathway VirJ component
MSGNVSPKKRRPFDELDFMIGPRSGLSRPSMVFRWRVGREEAGMNRAVLGISLGAGAISVLGLVSITHGTVAALRAPAPAAAIGTMRVTPSALDGSFRIGEVGQVTTYRPAGPVQGVVLFLSGDGGWNLGVIDMARALTRQGIAVVGISTPVFQRALEADPERCVDPNVPLSALAQDVEHQLGLPRYIKPILVGYSSGATIAYAALAQAPDGMYRGAVSLAFAPGIGGARPWCPVPGLQVRRVARPENGWLFSPAPHLSAPWLVLQGLDDRVVAPAQTRLFTSRIPEAQLIELPGVGHGFSAESRWMPQFAAAFAPMLESPVTLELSTDAATSQVDDLPLDLVTEPAAPRTDLMAIMYSGDGGWTGLDRDIATRLAANGVPVVGVDSLDYFWIAKTPAQAGRDLGRIVTHFSLQWQRPRVILIGYSFGADDLPFIVDTMPPVLRSAVARISLLGLSASADFQFHLASWLDVKARMPCLPFRRWRVCAACRCNACAAPRKTTARARTSPPTSPRRSHCPVVTISAGMRISSRRRS